MRPRPTTVLSRSSPQATLFTQSSSVHVTTLAPAVTPTLMYRVTDWKRALVASGGWFRTSYLGLALANRLKRIGMRVPSCNPTVSFNCAGGRVDHTNAPK
jgi:hypothetical protein